MRVVVGVGECVPRVWGTSFVDNLGITVTFYLVSAPKYPTCLQKLVHSIPRKSESLGTYSVMLWHCLARLVFPPVVLLRSHLHPPHPSVSTNQPPQSIPPRCSSTSFGRPHTPGRARLWRLKRRRILILVHTWLFGIFWIQLDSTSLSPNPCVTMSGPVSKGEKHGFYMCPPWNPQE